jgi:murein peptide amidase A
MEHFLSGGRFGANQGCYCGETILIDRVLIELRAEALKRGWTSECFLQSDRCSLHAYRKGPADPARRVYLSTGIHGDEPAGPLAVLELLRRDGWPAEIELWLCPCLNPTGFRSNTRENAQGIDLNRDYRTPISAEVRAHVQWLRQQPAFDLALILHEDWEANGFYLYELNPDARPSLAEPIIRRVISACPMETAEQVDTWPARAGIIRPEVNPEERPDWPEALYLLQNHSPLSYTLEAPSNLELHKRVCALVLAVETALELILKNEIEPRVG